MQEGSAPVPPNSPRVARKDYGCSWRTQFFWDMMPRHCLLGSPPLGVTFAMPPRKLQDSQTRVFLGNVIVVCNRHSVVHA
jgi:hypothetical protein